MVKIWSVISVVFVVGVAFVVVVVVIHDLVVVDLRNIPSKFGKKSFLAKSFLCQTQLLLG